MLALRACAWFLARRTGLTLLTLWGLASLVFLMIKLMPGDEAQMAAGADASAAQVEAVRERLGLDAPAVMQYLGFLGRLLHGDLGTSTVTLQPVLSDLARVLPATLELVVIAMALNLLVAIPAGIVAAYRQNGVFDMTGRVTAIMLGGMPAFWLALVLQYVLGSVWRVVPISGQQSYGMSSPVVTGAPTPSITSCCRRRCSPRCSPRRSSAPCASCCSACFGRTSSSRCAPRARAPGTC